jgi:transposase, IS5 family
MKREEQLSFAAAGFDHFARSTKRAAFLMEMDRIVPWKRLCAVVALEAEGWGLSAA